MKYSDLGRIRIYNGGQLINGIKEGGGNNNNINNVIPPAIFNENMQKENQGKKIKF